MKNTGSNISRAGFALAVVLIAVLPMHAVRAADPLTTIRIALSPSDDDTAPLLYAKGTGMFERAGLDVQIQRLGSGSAVAAGVAGGAVDIGKSSLLSLINAHQRGVPFSIVASCALYNAKAPFDGLVVSKDSTIVSGADLNGKLVSTQSLNDIGEVATSAWVDQHGGDSKTLRYVEIPTSSAGAAVESRRVDAAILLDPVLSETVSGGKLRVIGHAFGAIAPAFLFSAWFATDDFIAKHPDAIRAFVKTIYDAGTYTNAHHHEAARVVADQIGAPFDAVDRATWSTAGTLLDVTQIQPVLDMAAKYGTIPKTFAARDMVSTIGLTPK